MRKEIYIEELEGENVKPIAMPWTNPEDEIIRKYYPKWGARAISKYLPGRTNHAIRCRAQVMGVKLGSYRVPTTQERKK